MYGSAADAKLDAMHEAREQDPLPDETPLTDEEIEEMYRFFAANKDVMVGTAIDPKVIASER